MQNDFGFTSGDALVVVDVINDFKHDGDPLTHSESWRSRFFPLPARLHAALLLAFAR